MKESKDFLCNVKAGDFVELGLGPRKVECVECAGGRVRVTFEGLEVSGPADHRVTVFRGLHHEQSRPA